MDTGHFISFHADSLGNILYNIIYIQPLWVKDSRGRGDTKAESAGSIT